MPKRFKLLDDAPVEVEPGKFETRVVFERYHVETDTRKKDKLNEKGEKIGEEDVTTTSEVVDVGFGETLRTDSDDKAAIKAAFLAVKPALQERMNAHEAKFKPVKSSKKLTEADLA